MDRYTRVEKPRPESVINENEIRITSQGLIRNYVSYATSLLQVNPCLLVSVRSFVRLFYLRLGLPQDVKLTEVTVAAY